MNTIETGGTSGEGQSGVTTRRRFLAGLTQIAFSVSAAGALAACDKKSGGKIQVYDLNLGYNDAKANFDSFFMSVRNMSSIHLPTVDERGYYEIQVSGNTVQLSHSSYNGDYIWKYDADKSKLETHNSTDLHESDVHLGKVMKLLENKPSLSV